MKHIVLSEGELHGFFEEVVLSMNLSCDTDSIINELCAKFGTQLAIPGTYAIAFASNKEYDANVGTNLDHKGQL